MRTKSDITAALALAASLLLAACHEGSDAEPTDSSQPVVTLPAAAHAQASGSPRERAVLAAMEQHKQWWLGERRIRETPFNSADQTDPARLAPE